MCLQNNGEYLPGAFFLYSNQQLSVHYFRPRSPGSDPEVLYSTSTAVLYFRCYFIISLTDPEMPIKH